ncbi:MAG: hypothetical protein QOH47_840 [Sphingomonadales bacterium]|jgi:hypothetical protein|nr:hypothetical protein [Sphingomonadales bacterium]
MARFTTITSALGLKSRPPTRAQVTEYVLTERSRSRALSDEESFVLEAAIVEQAEPRFGKNGRRHPRRHSGAFA